MYTSYQHLQMAALGFFVSHVDLEQTSDVRVCNELFRPCFVRLLQ